MKLAIAGIREATKLLARESFDCAVSIADHKIEGVYCETTRPAGLEHVPNVRMLAFHDTDGERGPQRVHAEALCSFLTANLHRERWLIHCAAGVSRSTAAALVLLGMKLGYDNPRLATLLLYVRPQAYPNKQLIVLCEDVLGLATNSLSRHADSLNTSNLLVDSPAASLRDLALCP